MLHFFSVDELAADIKVGSAMQGKLVGIRNQVTRKLNNFMRRNLEYMAGAIEYFDTPELLTGSFNIWLSKKNIESLAISRSYGRAWDDYPYDSDRIFLDPEQGKIKLYGPFRRYQNSIRCTYDGGYRPREDDPEVMDLPTGLKEGALQQGIYDARRALSGEQGPTTDDQRRRPVQLVGGLLTETAGIFMPLRKPLG